MDFSLEIQVSPALKSFSVRELLTCDDYYDDDDGRVAQFGAHNSSPTSGV